MTFPRTLFTAHASRTHVKAHQTDFPVKLDNSSGQTHDSPLERPLRTKVTFRHGKAPKRHRGHQAVREPPSQARANSPPCSFRSGIGTKARRAASRPRRHPPPCSEPWQKPRSIRSDSMAPIGKSPKPSRLGSDRSRLPIPVLGLPRPRTHGTAPRAVLGCSGGMSSRRMSSRRIFARYLGIDPLDI